jgi:hypothetical protein
MKAKEYAPDLQPGALTTVHQHLVATNIRLPKGKDHLKAFLTKHPEAAPLQPALEAIFEGLENVYELGSLVQIEEPVEKELRYLREKYESAHKRGIQTDLFEPTIIQGELPLGVESYEQWKANILAQLEQHFAEESEVAEDIQSFFRRSAQKGLSLFEVLSQRYDVVTANPPYMGAGNLGLKVKQYLDCFYIAGKRDLYTAFILRCNNLIHSNGKVGMVTQQSWMFLRSFKDLRAIDIQKSRKPTNVDFQGLLRQTTLESLVHLGAGAFGEISGEVVNIALFIFAKAFPSETHRLTAFRLISASGPDEKKKLLLRCIQNNSDPLANKVKTSTFLSIVDTPLIYWLDTHLLHLFISGKHFSDYAFMSKGLGTCHDDRFVRMQWEANNSSRWWPLSKGGQYKRWTGLNLFVVDYEDNAVRIRLDLDRKFPYLKGNFGLLIHDSELFAKLGLVYSEVGRGSLGVRLKAKKHVVGHRGPAIYPNEDVDIFNLACILNSRLVSYLYRCIATSLLLDNNYLGQLPAVIPSDKGLTKLVQIALELSGKETSLQVTESSFSQYSKSLDGLSFIFKRTIIDLLSSQSIRYGIEGYLEKKVFQTYQIPDTSIRSIIVETGFPVGWYSLIKKHESLPMGELFNDHTEFSNYLQTHEQRSLLPEEFVEIKHRLHLLYQAGPIGKADDPVVEANENDDEVIFGSRNPIPLESFLEELSQKLQTHPISVYWLLKEGIEQEGWRCPPEEKHIAEDTFTVLILHLLGHRWPKQIEAGEPVPDWADMDGIISLTLGLPEQPMLERVHARLPEEFPGGNTAALEREFEEIMGESLEKWLGSSFFKHHISQFKKRPMAWQLSSRPGNGVSGKGKKKGLAKAPAFTCLVYYHKLDHNTLTTLQSQYVRPLRQSYETELRTLDNNPFLTPEQSGRRLQLEAWIDELKDFEARLQQCALEGFASPALAQVAANESLDRWTNRDGQAAQPATLAEFEAQEMRYDPDINDGVRVNIAPLQKHGLLAADVLDAKDIEKAIADRAEWRADERRWCREGKLPKPGWWI